MSSQLRRAMNYELIVRRQSFATADFTSLTTIGNFRSMFRDWRPQPLSTPTLFARPADCVRGAPGESVADADWHAYWPCSHDLVEIPGDHCTIVGEHVRTTADAVWNWLSRRHGSLPSPISDDLRRLP
jgi:tylactone synthase